MVLVLLTEAAELCYYESYVSDLSGSVQEDERNP